MVIILDNWRACIIKITHRLTSFNCCAQCIRCSIDFEHSIVLPTNCLYISRTDFRRKPIQCHLERGVFHILCMECCICGKFHSVKRILFRIYIEIFICGMTKSNNFSFNNFSPVFRISFIFDGYRSLLFILVWWFHVFVCMGAFVFLLV